MAYDFRKDFPLLQQNKIAYLDNAATAQRPQCVIDAESSFYRNSNANPLRGLYSLSVEATEIYENAREAVRDFLNASSTEEIIFTRGTTEGLNLVAYSYGLHRVKEGDEVLVSIMEHHSNLLPWQMVCRQTGAKLRFIECEPDGSVDLAKVEALINDRTKIVAINQVSNVLGRVNPVREIADMAHRHGAVIVVDGAQSTPHMPVNVRELDADFFAFSGHKVYGPMGIGVLYGREELLNAMPPFLTGGEMIDSVTEDGAVWAPIPEKFEAGTQDAAGIYATGIAIDYILEHGRTELEERERELVAYLCEKLQALPYIKIVGPDDPRAHIGAVSFMVDGIHPHDVSSLLDTKNIAIRAGHHCAQPLLTWMGIESCCRASVGFYNDKTDVDRLVEGLDFVWGGFNG